MLSLTRCRELLPSGAQGMSDAELEKLRGQLYLLAQAVCETCEGRPSRSMRDSSALEANDLRGYDHGGSE